MRRVFRIPSLKQSKDTIAREVDEELAFHVDARTQQLVDAGYAYDVRAAKRCATSAISRLYTSRVSYSTNNENGRGHEPT